MPNISRTIPNLIQGVSQQPPTARRETQSEFELNTFPTIIEGLIKRPPTNFLGTTLTSTSIPFVHWIQRDRNTRNAVLVTDTEAVFVDVDTGTIVDNQPLPPALQIPDVDKRARYAAQTIADLTFIQPKETVVRASTTTAPIRAPEAIINVRAGNFARAYRVIIDGVVVREMLTPLGDAIGETGIVATDAIASFLNDFADPDPFPGFPDSGSVSGTPLSQLAGFVTVRRGSLIHIRRADGGDFDIRVEDGQNNDAMNVGKNNVQSFSDLPRESPVNGAVFEVTGTDSNNFDGYFVEWDDTDSVWVETIEPGGPLGLDSSTMPHTISRQADGASFILSEADYLDRMVGNGISAPNPPFVDRNISAFTYFRGRLGIMAGEDIFFSTSGELFNYFPETVTQNLADAPLGFTSTSLSVNEFTAALEISERLYVFADNGQFILQTGPSFTLDQSDLLLTTQIETSPDVAPVTIGSEIFLPTTRGINSGITALFIDEITSTSIGEDETDHTPRYIPANVHSFTECRPEETIFVLSKESPNLIYTWRFSLAGRQREQSAWTTWQLECDEIVSAQCFGTTLYAFVRNGTTYSLVTFDISPAATDPLQDYVTHLDWRVTEAECNVQFDADTNTTLIIHPAIGLEGLTVASRGGDPEAIGERADPVDGVTAASATRVVGDWSNRLFHCGLEYPFIYEFTSLYVRDQQGTAIQTGRLQVRYIRLDFTDTGYFEIETTPEGRSSSRKVFEGRRADSPVAIYDQPSLETGTLSQGVMGEGRTARIRILNDSIFPANFQTAEWEGNYQTRSRRI